jgi:hypothetical protein
MRGQVTGIPCSYCSERQAARGTGQQAPGGGGLQRAPRRPRRSRPAAAPRPLPRRRQTPAARRRGPQPRRCGESWSRAGGWEGAGGRRPARGAVAAARRGCAGTGAARRGAARRRACDRKSRPAPARPYSPPPRPARRSSGLLSTSITRVTHSHPSRLPPQGARPARRPPGAGTPPRRGRARSPCGTPQPHAPRPPPRAPRPAPPGTPPPPKRRPDRHAGSCRRVAAGVRGRRKAARPRRPRPARLRRPAPCRRARPRSGVSVRRHRRPRGARRGGIATEMRACGPPVAR